MFNEKDIEDIRDLFPVLKTGVNYLDSAATALKPALVIQKLVEYYEKYPVNTHRAVYSLAEKATLEYESAREKIRNFINAHSTNEIIITKGTTESINLVAYSWGEININQGDEILITQLEHHSNIIPWQNLCKKKNAKLKIIPIDDKGDLELVKFDSLLNKNVKIVCLTHLSNAIGTLNPIDKITAKAHSMGSLVLLDAAQSIARIPTDVQKLDVDFLCFSGHKMYGPTGVGILYAKKNILEKMSPYQTGGGMIIDVTFDNASFAPLPYKFEAGTPPIAELIALGRAIDFINSLGIENILDHETKLIKYLLDLVVEIPSVRKIGKPKKQVGVCSLFSELVHPHDLGTLLNEQNICVRAGHHCAQPLLKYYKIPASLRVSLGVYNNFQDIENFVLQTKQIIKVFI